MTEAAFQPNHNPYIEIIKSCIPRLLTLQDRNPFSITYGCFDRPYWHFKTVTDFPNMTCQQAILTLALIYTYPFSENIYFKNKKILEWIIAGIQFWARMQHKDGSIDEFFPYDRSFCGTAFTTYAMAETLSLIQDKIELPCSFSKKIQNKIQTSSNWLLKNNNLNVANQMLGASLALLKVYHLTQDARYLFGSKQKMDMALQLQNPEGWFYEYGGSDIGYLSVAIDFLARYYLLSKEERVKDAAIRAIRFLQYFIHPNGTAGGEYGSRNTQYILPFGLEVFSEFCNEAKYILHLLYKGISERHSLSPLSIEDRYFSFFYLPNYTSALYYYCPKDKGASLKNGTVIFDQAGLIHYQKEDTKVIIGASKNGIIKIFYKEDLVFSDVGFFGKLANGQVVTSQVLNSKDNISIHKNDEEVTLEIQGQFIRVYNKLPMRKYLIPFRIFNYVFLRFDFFHKLFEKFFKRKLIIRKRKMPLYFNKKIILNPKQITIKDEIKKHSLNIKEMNILQHGTAMYNATSTCYVRNELTAFENMDFSPHFNSQNSLQVLRKFNFQNNTLDWQILN